MAPATGQGTEDVLGALYAWDSVVENDFALPPGHQDRDEDRVGEAYEQMIHTASGKADDAVLSLAAQLLTRHFFRFPHVQLNVVGVLLALCQPAHAAAVRIHTVHSLLQIVKTPPAAAAADTPTSAAAVAQKNTRQWLQLIDKEVRERLPSESQGVVLRKMAELRDALKPRLQTLAGEGAGRKKPRDEVPRDAADLTAEPARKKPRAARPQDPEAEDEDKSSAPDAEAPPSGRVVKSEAPRPRRPTTPPTSFSPRNCPPGPYLFLGSLPRQTTNAEVAEYLSTVCPEIDSSSVQLKQPHDNATAYAFVSLPSTSVAREAICFVAEHKLHGQIQLNANFARGPPVNTVLFVEWTGVARAMEDVGAVRECDFSQYDESVWRSLCDKLERVGPIEYARDGCVRFRKLDHARLAVRMHHFEAKGHDLFPVYDTKEQFAIDSTRRGSENYAKKNFVLTTGRRVGGYMGDGHSGNARARYKDEDDKMDGSGGHHEHDRVASLRYGNRSGSSSSHGRSRSPPRSDRGSGRGRSRSRSRSANPREQRYEASPSTYGHSKAHRPMPPHSRSRSPVPLEKQASAAGSGYGTPSNKENRHEYRGKFDSPQLLDTRGHGSPVRVDELRGRLRERDGPWMGSYRPSMDQGESQGSQDGGRGRSGSRYGPHPPPPPSSMRVDEKHGEDSQRHVSNYRRSRSPGKSMREPHQREGLPRGGQRGRSPPRVRSGPHSRSRSPPRQAKHSSPGPGPGRAHSRSRSPRPSTWMDNHPNQRPDYYKGRGDYSVERRPHEDRSSFQPSRPRNTDNRSIAEVARDEQEERHRLFQHHQQGPRVSRDPDLDRYGARGRGGGRGRDAGDARSQMEHYHTPPPYREEPSPSQQRENSIRERRGDFSPMPPTHGPVYSPPPSPVQRSNSFSQRKVEPEDALERQVSRTPEAVERSERDSSRHDHRRRHESRSRSGHAKGHRGHHEYREKRSSRSGRSRTPSPARRDSASASNGRKSNGASPRHSFGRRDEGSNQEEDPPAKEQVQRSSNDAEQEPQQKETKKGVKRLAHKDPFESVDDTTVDYEEDD